MKNVLVLIHDDEGQESRLQAALDITRALGGHLTCLDVTPMQIVPSDVYSGDAMVTLLEDERKHEGANRAHLRPRLEAEDVAWDWIDATGFMERCVEECAGMADIIVVSRQLEGGRMPDMRRVASGLIVNSGKPIVAVPPHEPGFRTDGAALVAWDGSAGACAALGAAVPLLRVAASVTIIAVEDGSIASPATEAAAYLSRHGVHAEVESIAPDGDSISSLILAKANGGRFDYVVMGGFGHARLVEAILGGVTRRMLSESRIPLFLAH